MKYKKLDNQAFSPTVFASALLLFIVAMLTAPVAMALNLTVMGADHVAPPDANNAIDPAVNPPLAETPLTGYRWLIEEDKTYHVPLNPDGTVKITGGAPEIDPNWRTGPDGMADTADDPADRNTISVNFHHSYMPVVATGNNLDAFPLACGTEAAGDPCLDSTKNYFISVLPDAIPDERGYSLGGAPIKAGQTDVTVYVNRNPIPTTQITVFVHADIAPINNVWDQGELGLEGFSIILEDAGGKYGASAGIQSLDAFGNPICTTYQYVDANGDGEHNPGEIFVSDATGAPIVDVPGAGCVTGADGTVNIRNLAAGKYGIMTVPPNGVEILDADGNGTGNYLSTNWTQTSTIEGKKLLDAWVKANEPAFFGEFGPPGPHVSIGYVPAGRDKPYIDDMILTGGATITGQVVNLHLSRPPATAFYSGGPHPHTNPWVGLNMGAAGLGKGIYAARTNEDGTFAIPDVPAGSYQLVVWDDNMDLLFARNTVVVNGDTSVPPVADGTCNTLTSCDLGDVPVFQWFSRMEHYVFNDENENGMWDADELPMIEQNVNLRWRDGTIYQAFPTDATGVAPFDEVFPFFSWLVSEVDFARFKATGATVVVDDGGAVPFGDPWAFDDNLAPQAQDNPADPTCLIDPLLCTDKYRTELGPVLTEAFQGFLGQTNVVQWGKKAYGPGENGGISGMVMYAVTRAENDPEQAAAEPWEPGIPGVTVNLYDRRGTLLMSTETDSWDDSLPTDCQYGANAGTGTDDPFVFRGLDTDCYDGMRNWNQVRPGVFDGGYAFGPTFSCADDFAGTCPNWVSVPDPVNAPDVAYIRPGRYEVEVIPPAGYEVIKSQDRNVDFGDTFFPSPELLPPSCVGTSYEVPTELALFPGEPAPLAGQFLPMCDRKLVKLFGGANAAADFFLFTEVPIAGHFIGFILDDTANEFDPASPQFGEKYAPPFLPVSVRDWTGREISRTISDEYGVYNALIPSTFTENLGQPSGISPNMLTTCMNAKSLPDGSIDPLHNPQYSQFCYTFQYMPGSTTYLDTPVVPVAAFAGADQNPLDCAFVDVTPRIHSVDVSGAIGNTDNTFTNGGPYIATTRFSGNFVVRGNQTITIKSMGMVEVPNPAYDGVGGTENKTIFRDYGFGSAGTLDLEDVPLTNIQWGNDVITADLVNRDQISGGTNRPGGRQLTVTRSDGNASITGVTVQVGLRGTTHGRPTNPNQTNGNPGVKVISVSEGESIQDAIDIAGARDLILVAPGTYNEMVIMWKPVQLQGWGEGSVTIDAIKTPFEKLAEWRRKIEQLDDGGLINRAPGQEAGFGGIEPAAFFSEEGAGVLVVAPSAGLNRYNLGRNKDARVDGFTITGADTGGGVVLNAYVDFMDVSNNNIVNNSAFFAGGVRIGHPLLTIVRTLANGTTRVEYSDANNDFDRIHHNTITQNGGLFGAGGGIGLHTGSTSYQVTDNFVCGNFTTASGAGIAHYGFSDKGLIKGNTVLFNENFNQGTVINGGGILVAGMPANGCPVDPVTGEATAACLRNVRQRLSPGAGSVTIDSNLVQGNSAGVGDGAGIRLSRINGLDVRKPTNNNPATHKYTIDVLNNIIVDNVAGLAGGGISIQDALEVNIIHNTIANNDSTATSGEAFTPGIPDMSTAQPGAGIIFRDHSADLQWRLNNRSLDINHSESTLVNNIVWHNRQFFWMSDTSVSPPVNGLCPDIGGALGLNCGLPNGNDPVYDDLALGFQIIPLTDNILTGGTDPAFLAEYVNGSRNTVNVINEGTTSMQAPPAFDEGGNFIRLRYGPLTQTKDQDTGELFGDYHIGGATNPQGSYANVLNDFDGQMRDFLLLPDGTLPDVDIGADEVFPIN